jgi:hypothetical protein
MASALIKKDRDKVRTKVERCVQYIHFPSAFNAVLHAALAVVFIYCRQKSTAAKQIPLQTPQFTVIKYSIFSKHV